MLSFSVVEWELIMGHFFLSDWALEEVSTNLYADGGGKEGDGIIELQCPG